MKIIPIIYQDKALIIVEKPANLNSVPNFQTDTHNVQSILEAQIEPQSIFLCHRLDKETTGLMIFAKSKLYQKEITDQFQKQTVRKTYLAFIQGHLNKKRDTLKSFGQSKYEKRPLLMITEYEVTEERPEFSIVKAHPITGRTNQIRIQFQQIKHPLVGESVYAFRKDFKLRFKRTALHSHQIEFIHPLTKQTISFTSPLPQDMQQFLTKN